MKSNLIRFLLVFLSAFFAASAFACDPNTFDPSALNGTWVGVVYDLGIPHSSTKTTWTIDGNSMEEIIDHNDYLSEGGDPYYESKRSFVIEESRCVLRGRSSGVVSGADRNYGEPGPLEKFENSEAPISIRYGIELENDGKTVLFTDADRGVTITLHRAN